MQESGGYPTVTWETSVRSRETRATVPVGPRGVHFAPDRVGASMQAW